MILNSSMFALLRTGLASAALLVLGGCAQERELAPLGARAIRWVGPEKEVLTGWVGLSPSAPLRLAISDLLQTKGVTLSDGSRKKFWVQSIVENRDRSYFIKHPWKSADFNGDRREFIGDDQRCYVEIGGATEIISVSVIYEWNGIHVDLDVLRSCLSFGFGR